MASTKNIAKEYAKLARTIDSFSDGQAILQDNDFDNLQIITVAIKPNDGLYRGGTFIFDITLQDDEGPPRIDCKTEILHPNIDYETQEYNICLNLFDEWEADFGVDDIIQGLLFLFYEPNWDDPLNDYVPVIMNNERELSYAEIIQKTLLGLAVADQDWAFNYEGDDLEELKAKYTGSVINTSEIPQAPPLPQNIVSNNANDIPPAPPLPQNVTSTNVNNIPTAPPLPQNITSNNANDITPAPPLPQNITSDSVNNIPPAPPLPENITSDSVNSIPPAPTLPQSITSDSVNNIPPAPPLPQNITSDSVNNIPPAPPLPQNITSDSVNNIPPAPPLPQNITSDSVNNIAPDPLLAQHITSNNAYRMTSVTLQPPQQMVLYNSVLAPSLTNCLQHGELPVEQLNDETPVLPVHGRGVTVGAASQMCHCSHRAEVQYSDDTHTDTIGHRQKPKESMVRSRFVMYLGNILLKINKLVTCTSFHKR